MGRIRYDTDAQGRVIRVRGQLRDQVMDRNSYQQNKAGKAVFQSGDQGGHLFASILGGSGDRINATAMLRFLNLSEWKVMENALGDLVRAGHRVEADITLIYKDGNLRPSALFVDCTVDGVPIQRFPFQNPEPTQP